MTVETTAPDSSGAIAMSDRAVAAWLRAHAGLVRSCVGRGALSETEYQDRLALALEAAGRGLHTYDPSHVSRASRETYVRRCIASAIGEEIDRKSREVPTLSLEDSAAGLRGITIGETLASRDAMPAIEAASLLDEIAAKARFSEKEAVAFAVLRTGGGPQAVGTALGTSRQRGAEVIESMLKNAKACLAWKAPP